MPCLAERQRPERSRRHNRDDGNDEKNRLHKNMSPIPEIETVAEEGQDGERADEESNRCRTPGQSWALAVAHGFSLGMVFQLAVDYHTLTYIDLCCTCTRRVPGTGQLNRFDLYSDLYSSPPYRRG